MTLNKLALVLGFGMSVVAGAASAADQGHGTVKFTGSIIDAPCSITPDTENQTVPLGQISTAALKDGGRSNSRDFKIALENAPQKPTKRYRPLSPVLRRLIFWPVPWVLRGLPKTRRLLLLMRAANRSN